MAELFSVHCFTKSIEAVGLNSKKTLESIIRERNDELFLLIEF